MPPVEEPVGYLERDAGAGHWRALEEEELFRGSREGGYAGCEVLHATAFRNE